MYISYIIYSYLKNEHKLTYGIYNEFFLEYHIFHLYLREEIQNNIFNIDNRYDSDS